jgi:phosphoribosylformimino-5-aminoimidazole carboxamide ribotide isomerase
MSSNLSTHNTSTDHHQTHPYCKFRPCIDIHDGKVKQIVGSTLKDDAPPTENFVSTLSPKEYAELYAKHDLRGGHVILLGPNNEQAAVEALKAFPQGLQIGGGVNASNALMWLEAGASHVIVTSWVFRNGIIDMDRLQELSTLVTKNNLVLDLSCKKKSHDGPFYVVTDRWQKYTDFTITKENLDVLSQYCDEFLVHAVDVEGMMKGIIPELVDILSQCCSIPVTYAGGVRNLDDCEEIKRRGNGKVDVSIGSALDIFGGQLLKFDDVVKWSRNNCLLAASVTTSNNNNSPIIKRTKTDNSNHIDDDHEKKQ